VTQVRNFDQALFRKSFSNNKDKEAIPHLISLQRDSYKNFLQIDVAAKDRANVGIQSVFNSFFPISDSAGRVTVEFVGYDLGQPKYEAYECLSAGRTFSAPLRAQLRLILWHQEEGSEIKEIRSIKEQEVYLCDIPLMTESGSFIVNGAERVIVSQMRRAPGVFFDSENVKISGSKVHTAKIIPYIGSWLDFEFDSKDIIYFRVDKKRKIPVLSLLRAILRRS
jgi:DNA-directed RNA polymerase subunit beta